MTSEIAQLARIREDRDWSYERMAREIGTITGRAVARVLNGETQPSQRTQRQIKRYLARVSRHSRRPQ